MDAHPLVGRLTVLLMSLVMLAGCVLLSDKVGPPPPAVTEALARSGITFVPLTEAQMATVRVTASAAKRTALADVGEGYGFGNDRVVWEKVGCVFLGHYTGFKEPEWGYVPPTLPAYLVQVLADPVPNYPMINIGVVVIDATTGERVTALGAGEPPSGIMGTTCGVSP